MPYCANCGHEVAEGVAFCPQCGAALQANATPSRQYAGFWRRVGGHLIDGLIISIVAGVLSATMGGGMLAGSGEVGGLEQTSNGISALLTFGYFWFFVARGQTLGQAALGIRLVDAEGNAPGNQKALIRTLMAFVSALALGLGYLWAAFHREKRTWHDLVAGTWAVRV
ncbi:MAG: RDD family protein [Dehalococcoidia bacterium]|nr:RDD family protein [Dehalococcoidia bacterium]